MSTHLIELGFIRGVGFPAVFWHPARQLRTIVHGDDYVSAGFQKDLLWLEHRLEQKYEIKTQVVGQDINDATEGKVLNRVIRVTREGWELEADPRHAELISEQMGVESGKGLSTPGVPERSNGNQHNMSASNCSADTVLSGRDITLFRGVAARSNYLGMDRPDIQFSAKELCREMSAPTLTSLRKMKRLARYLKFRPRLVWKYPWQAKVNLLDIYADANWAGCLVTRKSTSGGCIMLGSHCLKTWSKTQATIAKSLAESELFGVVRASCEWLGL